MGFGLGCRALTAGFAWVLLLFGAENSPLKNVDVSGNGSLVMLSVTI